MIDFEYKHIFPRWQMRSMQWRSAKVWEQRGACGAPDSALCARNVHRRAGLSALVVRPELLARVARRALPPTSFRAPAAPSPLSLSFLLLDCTVRYATVR